MRLGKRSRALSGERVDLRPHRRENLPLYVEWYADPEIWNLTSWREDPMSPAETRRLFEDRDRATSEASFAIHLKNENPPIGVIGLMNVSDSKSSADLSIIIGSPENRRLGYGTEAIRLILHHGFEDLGLERVGLSVFDFNERAISAYRKLGFGEEGRMRRAIRRSGEFHDAILMGVLARDFDG